MKARNRVTGKIEEVTHKEFWNSVDELLSEQESIHYVIRSTIKNAEYSARAISQGTGNLELF